MMQISRCFILEIPAYDNKFFHVMSEDEKKMKEEGVWE